MQRLRHHTGNPLANIKMKYIIQIVLFLLVTQLKLSAQEMIDEAKLEFELPNEHWSFTVRQVHGNTIVYTYKRDFILDSSNRKIVPQISFIIEPVDSTIDIIQYSILKRSKVPFEVIKMFSHKDGTMKFQYGVGYQGKYEDRELEHRIYVVHGIYNSMGITLIMDTTEEIADIVTPEFLKCLATFDTMK
jgi:hypothetical protein